MTIDELKRNIAIVNERIARAAMHAEHSVTLVAATKTVPADIINAAIRLGVSAVGENRVQEYRQKKDAVQGAEWHFIGTLQTNKAKYLVGNVSLIQSVNSTVLAHEIDKLAKNRGIVQDVLIEVNAAGETCKTGAPIDAADELTEYARSLNNIRVRGLMSVPPKNADRSVYELLYKTFDRLKTNTFDILSVGMSSDYETAIENGSNMVRIGAAIFGERKI